MQSQTLVDRTTIEDLVKRQVAEMLAKSETAIFEPFFRSRQVMYELRRLQNIPEQRVHALRYEPFGCMLCKRGDKGHGVSECAGRVTTASPSYGRNSLENSSRRSTRDAGFKVIDLQGKRRGMQHSLLEAKEARLKGANPAEPKGSG
jgi:hypothetical protein